LGLTDAAIDALERSIQLAPTLPQAHFNLALAYEDMGRLDDAVKEYRAAVSARGDYPEASSALGKLLFRMGKTDLAEGEIKTALRLNPDLTDAHYTFARILHSVHLDEQSVVEFAEAKDLADRRSNGVQSSELSNRALELASNSDLAGAVRSLRQAVALKPDYGVPHYNLGLILADQGQIVAAEQELAKAISLLPGQPAPWLELGRVRRLAKDNVGAWEAIAWAAHLAPSDQAIHHELASIPAPIAVKSTSNGTMTLSQPKVGALSDTVPAHYEFASELIARGDLSGAVGELLRSLALDPAMANSRRSLADTYVRLEQNDRAKLEYYKLLLIFPDDPALRTALGKVLLAQGDKRGAAEQLRHALGNDPKSQEARTLLSLAEQPTGHPK
jgi:tetratricopeptide (TPR) repeat protein